MEVLEWLKNKEIQELIKEVVKKIVSSYSPSKIILFGSYAYGKPDEYSDIDLLIIKDTKERPIDRWMSVCQIISNRRRRISFEPIVITPKELEERIRVGDQLVDKILTQGEVLYEEK